MDEQESKEHKGIGHVIPQSLSEEMRTCYLDYAMSVIITRALPDVRDGMKPVHRRILYAMWQEGLRSTAKFRKSATVVGRVLGDFHPHGDTAVYDAMVRMAQDFSLRYMLVKGQGNFGSVDGDGAAAYRYTEAKLSAIAEELLFDIEKQTVDFAPNFDGSKKEPTVLPAKLPNLLLNGTLGIAVGMATNIPPHNLTELCNGITAIIDDPEIEVDDLIKLIPGPDFPTGGIIYDKNEIKQAYATGKGGIVMRAATEIIEEKAGQFRILVSEIPYAVNKSTLLEKIATLVQEKKIEGIRGLSDESNKDGIRIVIDLKKDSYPKKVLNQLFKMTPLQETFHVNMLALTEGGMQPRVLTLKDILTEYINHRKEVVRRRTEFDLNKAKDRAHILEGLRIALLKIDKVIETIKKSKDKDEARANLMKNFKLSEIQSTAILEMRLQQLANLERLKVEQEYQEKLALIKELEAILKSVKKMLEIIKGEVLDLKERFGDARRTKVIPHPVGEFSMVDLVPDETAIVMLTSDGYIKRLPPDTFRTQGRGGKGITGLSTKEQDEVFQMFSTRTHTDILFFTSRGRVFQLKAYEIPQGSRTSKGQAIVNFLQLSPGERAAQALPLADMNGMKYMMMVTSQGTIKKVALEDFKNVRRSGLIAINLHEGDDLEWVKPTTGKDEVSIVTENGQSIRFNEEDVRPMGRAASGVRGIKLKKDDSVVGMDIINSELAKKGKFTLFTLSSLGLGKQTNIKEFKVQNRGGSGVRAMKVTAKTGKVVAAFIALSEEERDLMMISKHGIVIRQAYSNVPLLGRDTQGVRLMRFKDAGDSVSSVTFVGKDEENKLNG
ncbi:MAG: DNA gyrase subunit A [Patescibacteria group bacterium]|nr:DNA gyrase subunit A [Patescibacteria group bacterium]